MLSIKKSIKSRPNDLKFCTHIPNDKTKLLQLSEFYSYPYIKISPINRNRQNINFANLSLNLLYNSKTHSDRAPKSQITSQS